MVLLPFVCKKPAKHQQRAPTGKDQKVDDCLLSHSGHHVMLARPLTWQLRLIPCAANPSRRNSGKRLPGMYLSQPIHRASSALVLPG